MVTFFRGRRLVTPMAVSYVDDSGLLTRNVQQPGGVVACLGMSAGGQPQTVLTFTNPADARRVLRDGELLDAVLRAFAPSGDTPGAGTVLAVRVNPATQSTLVLKDTNNQDAITLTSRDWGAHTALTRVKVETATVGRTLTVLKDGESVSGVDIGAAALQLQYIGTGDTATVTVTGTQLSTVVQDSTSNPIPADQVTLSFAVYATLQQLADALNATGKYTAVVLYPNAQAAPTVLDAATGVNIKTAPAQLRADGQAAADWFNNYAAEWVQATRVVGTGPLQPLGPTPVYLTGGAEGNTGLDAASNSANWTAAFTALQTADCQLVVPVTPDAALHAAAQTHVAYMSDPLGGRSERIAIVGGPDGETVAQAKARAQALNDKRVVLVYPSLLDTDPATGALVTIPPYRVAAQIAGLIAGLGVADPITRRAVRAKGVSLRVTASDRDDLQLAGVLVLEQVPNGGVRVVHGVTTWTGDSALDKQEISVLRAADFTARAVRDDADALLVGQKAGPALVARARSTVFSTLDRLVRDGVLVGDDAHPAFRNIQVTMSGDALIIEFEAVPAVPANYVTITAHLQPFATS